MPGSEAFTSDDDVLLQLNGPEFARIVLFIQLKNIGKTREF